MSLSSPSLLLLFFLPFLLTIWIGSFPFVFFAGTLMRVAGGMASDVDVLYFPFVINFCLPFILRQN